MKVSLIQLNMTLCDVESNYQHAEKLIRETVREEKSDVILLPETWSTGYYPKESLASYCEHNGETVKSRFCALAEELNVNIVAGSIANVKSGKIYNTAYVFNRKGEIIGEYDKTHLFTPMDEHKFFEYGNELTVFELDGHRCGIIICYDIRFPEIVRSLALKGIEMLFAVSQWPKERIEHLKALSTARAVENQMFVACCNSCGEAYGTRFGGSSRIISPLGEILAEAGESEEVVTAECDFTQIKNIRESINVFNDRKPELY